MAKPSSTYELEASYTAFLSYSHADARLVRKLHSQLETYSLPKGLGEISSLNSSSGRLGKVFRDREDLAVAQDLSKTVKSALEQSQVLLVVCSPNAKGSRWVEQEIAYFKKRHPERPILAAILSGEPAEAFPEALTEGDAEPLAADLRKEGDGWRLGFLKLVAGIAGVPLDTLIERDARRNLRRVMAVTGVVALIAIGMGLMTTVAIQARDEAIESREVIRAQSAEQAALNSYFLNDFREVLLARSQLNVAIEFYPRVFEFCSGSIVEEFLDSDYDAECAQYLRVMGTDLVSAGRLDEAGQYFTTARGVTGRRLAADPDDADLAFDHYLSLNRVGFLNNAEEEYTNAEAVFSEAHALLLNSDGASIGRTEWLRHRSYSHGNYGNAILKAGGSMRLAHTHALASVRVSLRLIDVEKNDSGLYSDLSFHLAIFAEVQLKLGEFGLARRASLTSVSIAEALTAGDPENVFFREQLMQVYQKHSFVLGELGSLPEQERYLSLALELAGELGGADPTNKDYAIN